MKKNKLIKCLNAVVFISLTVILLVSCSGCGGLKEGNIEARTENSTKSKVKSEESTKLNKPIKADPIAEKKISQIELRKRLTTLQTVNNKSTIRVAKQHYGEKFVSRHYFKMLPIQDLDILADKSKALFIGEAINNVMQVPTRLFKYDLNDSIHFAIDLTIKNPYYKYIKEEKSNGHVSQSSGYHHPEVDLSDLPEQLRIFLNEQEPMYSTRINTWYNRQGEEYLLLNYEFALHPPSEIVEFEPFPALSTIEILNSRGKSIGILNDLPFKIDEWHITGNGEFVVFVHKQPIDDKDYQPHQFRHYFSIYHLASGQLCHREFNKLSLYVSGSPTANNFYNISIGEEVFLSEDSTIWKRHHITNTGYLVRYQYLNKLDTGNGKLVGINEDGILVFNKELKKEERLRSKVDFKIKKLEK